MVVDFRSWASMPSDPSSGRIPWQDFLLGGPASDEAVDLVFFVVLFITLSELLDLLKAGAGVAMLVTGLATVSFRFVLRSAAELCCSCLFWSSEEELTAEGADCNSAPLMFGNG